MILFSVIRRTLCKQQKAPIELTWFIQSLQPRRFTSSLAQVNDTPTPKEEKISENTSQQKILTVAIVGRTNAGKSTLINSILNLDICGVSSKSHTTLRQLKASFTEGDTQVVFMDTPGFVSKKEFTQFNLPQNFEFSRAQELIDKVDIVGVVHEVGNLRDVYRFPLPLVQCLNEIPESKPMFLVVNKIDKITDKRGLVAVIEKVQKEMERIATESNEPDFKTKLPVLWKRFSKIFFISALESSSARQVADYLLQQAKPGSWVFKENEVSDKPLNLIVMDILRAEMLNLLPQEVPYQCRYKVEYMKENDLGEIICVCLVECLHKKHVPLIVDKRKVGLRTLCKKIESSLFKILGKVFRMRVVVVAKPKPKVMKSDDRRFRRNSQVKKYSSDSENE